LYLNRVTFDQYNRKFSRNHKPLLFNSKPVQQRVQKFKWQEIVSYIVGLEAEGQRNPCFQWLFLMQQYPSSYKFFSLTEFKEEKNVRYLDNEEADQKNEDVEEAKGGKGSPRGAGADDKAAAVKEEAVKEGKAEEKAVKEEGKASNWGDQDILSP
jgi:hypothetical protein